MAQTMIGFSLLVLVLLSFSALPADAGGVEEFGAYMTQKGMELFVYSIGDSMIEFGSNTANVSANRTDTAGMIVALVSYSVDPYEISVVNEWNQVMIVFFVGIIILMILYGGAMVLIAKKSPDMIEKFTVVFELQRGLNIREWLSNIGIAVALLLFGTFGFHYLLQIEYVVSSILATHAITAAPPIPENMISYVVMALCFFGLAIVMAVRVIIILLMAAGLLGLFGLYLIPQTKEFAASAFMYFLVVLFLQPALLFIAAVSMSFIGMLPLHLLPIKNIITMAACVFMVYEAAKSILGLGLTGKIVNAGSKLVMAL